MRLYGIYTMDPKFAAMVVEYCSLGDLRNYLDSNKPLHTEQRMSILMEIALVQYPLLLVPVSLIRSHV